MGAFSGMMQILHFLFNKRLYPVWIAGLIWFNMANGDVIAIRDGSHNWGGNDNQQISYCLIPSDLAEPGSIDPKLPDPYVPPENEAIIPVQPVLETAGEIEPEHINHEIPYLLYLLKRPPPRLYHTV